VKDRFGGPVIVKGVLDPNDARLAVNAGADAVIVSNHGGRQLDGAPSSIRALPEMVEAIGHDVSVYIDGGIRSGQDLLKALALGAKGAFVGRPILYGLGAGGEAWASATSAMWARTTSTATGSSRSKPQALPYLRKAQCPLRRPSLLLLGSISPCRLPLSTLNQPRIMHLRLSTFEDEQVAIGCLQFQGPFTGPVGLRLASHIQTRPESPLKCLVYVVDFKLPFEALGLSMRRGPAKTEMHQRSIVEHLVRALTTDWQPINRKTN
jgi:hypothetical protein